MHKDYLSMMNKGLNGMCLGRLWHERLRIQKELSCALLVGLQIGAATMENNMEFPQKTKNRTTIWHSNPTFGHLFGEK